MNQDKVNTLRFANPIIREQVKRDGEPTNADRAGFVASAIEQYQRVTKTDDEDAVMDMLCDLMHYCDYTDQDFEHKLVSAVGHHVEERHDEALHEWFDDFNNGD